jgi:hypothetical protein
MGGYIYEMSNGRRILKPTSSMYIFFPGAFFPNQSRSVLTIGQALSPINEQKEADQSASEWELTPQRDNN